MGARIALGTVSGYGLDDRWFESRQGPERETDHSSPSSA